VTDDLSERILERIRSVAPPGAALEIPPKVFAELGMRFVSLLPDTSLTCRFPLQRRFANPMGVFQGGIMTAALAVAFGCLAFLTAGRPCVSLTIETAFIRPLAVHDDGFFTVEVAVRSVTNTFVFLEGSVQSQKGEMVATASTVMKILREDTVCLSRKV